jgi:hypothetical protein
MMMGWFFAAQKMRLLFQHHTTLEKAHREHHLFGHQGYNFFARCGQNLAIVGLDGRTECDTQTVHHEKTWDMVFDRLENDLEGVEYFIVLFPVPFSFIRVHVAKSIFDHLEKLSNNQLIIRFT